MAYNGSYEIVEEIFKAAKEELGGGYSIDDEKFVSLEEICDIVDDLVEEFGGQKTYVEASFDKTVLGMVVSFSCEELTLTRGVKHEFFQLMPLIDELKFTNEGSDYVAVHLTVYVFRKG